MRSAIVAAVMTLVLLAGVALWTAGARAASAVTNHFPSDSIGWGTAPTKKRAAEKAVELCINRGAPDGFHRVWSKEDGPGWSAVYSATDDDYVTHSFRYKTKNKAKKQGLKFCENSDGGHTCELVRVFYDEYGPQKKNGKLRRPGNRVVSAGE